jgi:hypothetical protein
VYISALKKAAVKNDPTDIGSAVSALEKLQNVNRVISHSIFSCSDQYCDCQQMNLTVNEMASLDVAKTVSDLRQHASAELAALSKKIRNDWKQAFSSASSSSSSATTPTPTPVETIESKTLSSNKSMDVNIISNITALMSRSSSSTSSTSSAATTIITAPPATATTTTVSSSISVQVSTHQQTLNATLSKVSSLLMPMSKPSTPSLEPVQPIVFAEIGKYATAAEGVKHVYQGQNRGKNLPFHYLSSLCGIIIFW